MDLNLILEQLGLGAGGNAMHDVVRGMVSRFVAWADGGHLDRLFDELDSRFGSEPAYSRAALAPLAEDPEFVFQLALARDTGRFESRELAPIIERHVGWTETQTNPELALAIAVEIGRLLPRAQHDPMEGLHLRMDFIDFKFERRFEALEGLMQELAAPALELQRPAGALEEAPAAGLPQPAGARPSAPPVRAVGQLPALVAERLHQLREAHSEEAFAIEALLLATAEPPESLHAAAETTPGWLEAAPAVVWVALAEIADRYLAFDASRILFTKAAERPGSSTASCFARASMSARNVGDDAGADELLAQARAADSLDADVVFAQVFLEDDLQRQLKLLNEMPEPTDLRQRWFREIAIAQRLIADGKFAEADVALDTADELRGVTFMSRTFRSMNVLAVNVDVSAREQSVDRNRLRQAAEELLDVRRDLLDVGRIADGGLHLANAARASAIAGDEQRARDLLFEELTEAERTAVIDSGHTELAVAASLVAPERTLELTPHPDASEARRLAWAQALLLSDTPDRDAEVMELLDGLLEAEDERIRDQAAYNRLALALERGVPWSEEAADLLALYDTAAAATLTAERLSREGRSEEAKTLLLPHLHDAGARRVYSLFLWREERWTEVMDVLRPAVDARAAPVLQRLMYADAGRRAGEWREALDVLIELRGDEQLEQSERDHAFHIAALIADELNDFAELERLTADWLAKHPGLEEALWRRTYALFQLARHDEALQVAETHQLEPHDESEARLLAAVAERSLPIAEAVIRIRNLSDRFRRPERLEALLLITALRWRDDRPDEITEELSCRLEDFVGRFPESQAIRSVQIGTTPESIEQFFKEHIEPGATELEALRQQVINGSLPVPAYAASRSRPLSFTWWELQGMLPLAYPDVAIADADRADAYASIGRAVVFEPSSLTVPRFLPDEVQEAIRVAFPSARIVHSTLRDADEAADYASSLDVEHNMIGVDPVRGERWWSAVPAELAAARAHAMGSVKAEAERLGAPEPDADPDRPTEVDKFAADGADVGFRSWPASFSLARRRSLALYSDDRRIRLEARSFGLQTFGTVALVDALGGRGLISDEARLDARRVLRAHGALGLADDIDELIAEARTSDWTLTPSLRGALLDWTAWRSQPGEAMRFWVPFVAAARENPDEFPQWLARVVDAGVLSFPPPAPDHGSFARALTLVALVAEGVDGLFGDVVKPLRQMRLAFGLREDPLEGAWKMLEEFLSAPQYQPVGTEFRRMALRQLPLGDQMAIVLGVRFRERWER